MSTELNSSELGTKEYWEETYEAEIQNFQANGDVGEVWFGEDSMTRVINWMTSSNLINLKSSVIDLGCGNGVFLLELSKLGYSCLTGVDYSPKAVSLAEAVAKDQGSAVSFQVCDITAESLGNVQYHVCHDKGTYDAISLNPLHALEKRQRYAYNVWSLLKPDGLFILTSCNWTQQELTDFFKNHFTLLKQLPTPSFQFGGKTGHTQTALVFQKVT